MKTGIKGKLSLLCIVLGAALILVALWQLTAQRRQARQMERNPAQILARLTVPEPTPRVPQERGNNAMASMEVDGINVVAVLEIPQYGTRLPVASDWDTALLQSIPCRFAGSIYDSSLILGVTQDQLRYASRLEVGTRLVLTDLEGGQYTYRVEAIQHAKHATLEKLQEGDYPLTVFLKDSESGRYLLLRCATAGGSA